MSQDASGVLNLLLLQGTLSDPGTSLSPCLVQSQETGLATTLDELIGLCNELGTVLEEPREAQLSLVENSVDIIIVVEVQRGESGRRVVLGGLGKRARLDDIGAGEVIVDDGLAIGLVDSLCGHGVGGLWELKREGRVFCFPVGCSRTCKIHVSIMVPNSGMASAAKIVVALATLQLDKLRGGGLRKLITYDLPVSSGLGRLLTRIGELQTTMRNEERPSGLSEGRIGGDGEREEMKLRGLMAVAERGFDSVSDLRCAPKNWAAARSFPNEGRCGRCLYRWWVEGSTTLCLATARSWLVGETLLL